MHLIRLSLASARLSRFVTSDSLGDWLIVRPAQKWAIRHEGEAVDSVDCVINQSGEIMETVEHSSGEVEPENGLRSKAVSGLECPFCVGFWIGAGVLAADAALPERGVLRRLYDFGTKALAMNYVVGHVSAKLD